MGYHTQPCRGPSERGAEPSLPSEESSTREGEGPRDHRVVGFAGVLVEPRIGRVAPYAAYVLVKKKKKSLSLEDRRTRRGDGNIFFCFKR